MVPDGAQNAHCGLCSTSAPGTGYPSLPGSKKRLLLLLHGLPSVLLRSVLLTPPVVPPMGEWGQGGSSHPVYLTAKKSFGNQRAERTSGHWRQNFLHEKGLTGKKGKKLKNEMRENLLRAPT